MYIYMYTVLHVHVHVYNIRIYMILYHFSALQFYQGAHSEELGRYGEMVRLLAIHAHIEYILYIYIASPPPLSFLHPLPLSDISDAAHSPEIGLNIGEASQGNRRHSEDGQTELFRSRDG